MGLHAIDSLFPSGALGVDVFFTLSSFLISAVLITDAGGTTQFDYVRFYGRRAFRLLPALALWLVFIALPTAVATRDAGSIISSTSASLLYVANLSGRLDFTLGDAYFHAWSLSVEEQFYLVWPSALVLVLMRLSAASRRQLLIAAVLFAQVVFMVGDQLFADNYFLPTGHIVPLALGVLAADLWAYGMSPRLRRIIKFWPVPTIALSVLVLAVTVGDLARDRLWAIPMAGAVTALNILHVCLNDQSPVTRLLKSAPFVWIGQRSYGLYLYHRSLTLLVPALITDIRLTVAGPLVVIISLTVAWWSYRSVECPARRRGNAWLERRRGAELSHCS